MNSEGFANIRTQCDENGYIQGYQITFQSQTSGSTSVGKPRALRTILEKRNEQYREWGELHTLLMRRHAEGGITETFDNNGDGKRVECFRVQLRDLKSGKPVQRSFRFRKQGSKPKTQSRDKKAGKSKLTTNSAKRTVLKAAKELMLANREAFNEMVDRFNELTFQQGMKMAEREAKSLQPQLHKLKSTADKRWAQVYAEKYPDGLVNPVDPSSTE